MMPLMTHQSPAPMPMLLASGVEPALMSTVPRPMANPSMLSRNWTAMIRTTPPKMADQEMRRWIWEPPMTSVVVVSTAAGDLEDGESKVLADIHASCWEQGGYHPDVLRSQFQMPGFGTTKPGLLAGPAGSCQCRG